MPIIINEFEVVTEPATPPPDAEEPPQPPEMAASLRPEDIVRIQQRHRERMERLWAD